MVESRKPNKTIGSLLSELLDSRKNAAAWRTFLLDYGPAMMSAARQHAFDPHDAQDCFIHICEKLCEDDYRRLRAYDPSRGGSFATWVTAITANLSADWCRAHYGRPGVPPAIKSLPVLEQRVFRLAVVEGLDKETCLIGVRREFPETTRSDIAKALSAVHAALTSRQRWKFAVFKQRGRVAPLDPNRQPEESDLQANPQEQTARDERRAKLKAALEGLTGQERMLLRLRYEQEMTLEEVAAVVGLNDLHQARRKIQVALRKLSEGLQKADFL